MVINRHLLDISSIMKLQDFVRRSHRRKLSWHIFGSIGVWRRIGPCCWFVLLMMGCHGVTIVTASSVCTIDDQRCDVHIRCPIWKEDGECIRSQSYMSQHCPGSCENFRTLDIEGRHDYISNGTACIDRHTDCAAWAILGECGTIPDMRKYCAVSCGQCATTDLGDSNVPLSLSTCTDDNIECDYWARTGECDTNPDYMNQFCKKSCNTCQKEELPTTSSMTIENSSELQQKTTSFGLLQSTDGNMIAETVLQRIIESIAYMESEPVVSLDETIRMECQNRNELCTFWAVHGECEDNAAYMNMNCAPSCMTCHLLMDLNQDHCSKLADTATAALRHPGDLNTLFHRILAEAPGNRTDLTDDDKRALAESNTPIYTVHVHSQPGSKSIDEAGSDQDESIPPWVITLDNFLTKEECDSVIQLGYKYEYERSVEKVEGSYDDIESDYRTSENAWCSRTRGCRNETLPTRLHQRMAAVLGIPSENSEDLQILKYEVGQYYREHHDYVPLLAELQCGPRILTFFLYLSDVEGGGGTNFPELDITIEPKRGRALIWPSVHNANPMQQDLRMTHQALEVIAGTKFAANGWFHMYDFVTPQMMDCI